MSTVLVAFAAGFALGGFICARVTRQRSNKQRAQAQEETLVQSDSLREFYLGKAERETFLHLDWLRDH